MVVKGDLEEEIEDQCEGKSLLDYFVINFTNFDHFSGDRGGRNDRQRPY